jgi:hypothetical protein
VTEFESVRLPDSVVFDPQPSSHQHKIRLTKTTSFRQWFLFFKNFHNFVEVAYMRLSLIYCLRSDDMKVGTFIRSSLDNIKFENVRSLT